MFSPPHRPAERPREGPADQTVGGRPRRAATLYHRLARARAHPVRGQGGAHLAAGRTSAFIRSHSGPPTRTPGLDGEEIAVNLEQLRKQAKDLVRAARG